MEFLGFFAPFLIPTSSIGTEQQLSAALFCLVNVPVVAAARFKGHIGNEYGFIGIGEGIEVGLTCKVFGVGIIWFTQTEETAICAGIILIDLHRHAEGCPGIGPAGIECDMGKHLSHLIFCHTILSGSCQMVLERAVNHTLADQNGNGDHGAQLQGELIFPGPDFSEQHIIIQLCEFRRECSQGIAAGCLFYHRNFLLTLQAA